MPRKDEVPSSIRKTKVHISAEKVDRLLQKDEEKRKKKEFRTREREERKQEQNENKTQYAFNPLDRFNAARDRIKNFGKKKNNKRGMTWFSATVIVVAVLFLFVNALTPTGFVEYFDVAFSGFGSGDGFPINISASNARSLSMVDDDAVLLTDSSLIMYKDNGKMLFNRAHGFSNPAVCTSSIRALVYDRSGKKVSIETRSKTVDSFEVDGEIITADLGYNGYFALATRTDGYMSSVTVYNKNSTPKFVWNSSDRRVISLSLSDNGKYLAVGAVKVINGTVSSDVLLFNIDSTEPICNHIYEGSNLVSVDWKDSGAVAVMDNMLSYIDKSGNKTVYSFESAGLSCYSNSSSDGVAVAIRKYNDTTNNMLICFDDELEKTGEALLTRECISLYMDGTTINVLSKETTEVFNKRCELKDSYTVDSDMKRIVADGSFILTLGSSTLNIVE